MLNVTCQKDTLRPLNLLSRYVSSRPALPVLANLLFETSENNLTISATNLDVTVKAIIPALIEDEGKLTIPARPLAEMLAVLPSGKVQFSQHDEQCHISSNQTQATLATITPADFPVLPVYSQSQAFAFPIPLLQDIADTVLFAAATDESRPVLTNLLIKQSEDKLIFVATDGFRLSEQQRPLPENPPLHDTMILLPAKIVSEVLRVAAEIQAEELWIDHTTQTNQIALKVGNIEFYSKLVEAAFPNYERIIPRDTTINVECNREELLQAVKLSLVFAKDAGSMIRFNIQPADRKLEVIAQSANLGQNHTQVEAIGEGDNIVTAFNARFLTDMLNTLKAERLKLSFKSALAPMVVTIPSRSDFLHLIMPINID